MGDVIDVNVNEEGKAEEMNFFEKVGAKVKDGWNWCKDHKTECIAIATIAVPAAVDLTKTMVKRGTVKEEKRLKDNYIYDSRHRHYYETSKKLNSQDWRKIDQLLDEGGSLGDILDNMGLLKK